MSEFTDLDGLRDAVEAGLTSWLPRQRWYGAGSALRAVRCEVLAEIDRGAALVAACIARVDHEDGSSVRYNVPLASGPVVGLHPSDPAAVVYEDGETVVFDALADPRTAAPWWRVLASAAPVELPDGRLVPGGGEGLDPAVTEIAPLAREQSNTSLIVGSEHLMKVMRRVVFEPSVELEMSRALAATGFDNVAATEAWLHYERGDQPHGALLALAQPYLHNATEGWMLALTSLRDLYADAEEHMPGDAADRLQAVEDAGGSFTPDAARLGDITARMHLALSRAAGEALTPRLIDAALLDGWADEIRADLDSLVETGGDAVARLAGRLEPLRTRVDAIRGLARPGLAIRIHGDFHLGQVLRTDQGWTVLDFEGEPRRSVEHRRRLHSALRDVAGMLRSFDYAAAVALNERTTPTDPAWDHLAAHGRSWANANREAFWASYIERTTGSDLMPDPADALVLRRAFEIQKAVYEVQYEMAHRPTWVSVPLGFLLEATA